MGPFSRTGESRSRQPLSSASSPLDCDVVWRVLDSAWSGSRILREVWVADSAFGHGFRGFAARIVRLCGAAVFAGCTADLRGWTPALLARIL